MFIWSPDPELFALGPFHIRWYGLLFSLAFLSSFMVMLWIFRDFSIIYVLTGGGPLKATQTLSILTYEQAFSFFKMGYASAIGIITLIICVVAAKLMMSRAQDNL